MAMRISWVAGTVEQVLVLLLALPAAALAQGSPQPLTGELPVNTVETGQQGSPSVGMRDNGTHVVVWTTATTSGNNDIAQRRFPGDGTAPFAQSLINSGTTGNQGGATIDVNGAGNWVALWTTDQPNQGLRARALTNGLLGNEFEFTEEIQDSAIGPRASRAEDGSYVAVWRADGSKVRRFDSAGAPATGELVVGADLDFPQDPSVVAVADGEFWVVVRTADGTGSGIYRERYDALGARIGDAEPVVEIGPGERFSPDIDAAADGSFVVVWQDADLGVRGRCFSADGAARGVELAVDGASSASRIAVAPDGAFVVTWRDDAGDIGAREYDRTCRPVGGAFTVNAVTAGTQGSPDVATSNDRYVVVWEGPGAGGDGDFGGVARRLFRRRSVYADDFESNDLASWSATVP